MNKALSEMSLEELWQLFPVQLAPHNPKWSEWYAEERENVLAAVGDNVARIDHIGSTSVPGLVAKPIVDILLQIKPGTTITDVKARLVADGWLVMAEQPELGEIDLNKGYTPDGFEDKVFHLHVKPVGDADELHFRDYIATHPDVAAQYAELKQGLLAKFDHDRDGYTNAKTTFIKTATAQARVAKQGQ